MRRRLRPRLGLLQVPRRASLLRLLRLLRSIGKPFTCDSASEPIGVARLAFVTAAVALIASACGTSSSTSSSHTSTSTSSSDTSTSTGATGNGVTISVAQNSVVHARILVGSSGRTVYLFEKDTKDHSNCSSACRSVWPPVTSKAKPVAGAGVSSSLLGTLTAPGSAGGGQVTYNGHPLYYYVGDGGAGTAAGEGLNQFGGRWYVVCPAGNPIT